MKFDFSQQWLIQINKTFGDGENILWKQIDKFWEINIRNFAWKLFIHNDIKRQTLK